MTEEDQQTKPAEPKQQQLLQFFSHPLVGILGSLASVVGLLLAVYFYYASFRNRVLTYCFHPVRTVIASPAESSALSVSFGGSPVKDRVSALQIALWNTGSEPIRAEDVLEPVILKAPSGVRILEATIRSLSRPETRFALKTTTIAEGSVGFDWKVLELNDGASIQVIFEGPTDALFTLNGAIIGQRSIPMRTARLASLKSPSEQYVIERSTERWVGVGIVTISLSSVLFVGVILFRRRKAKPRPFFWIDYLIFTLIFFQIGLGVYILLRGFTNDTPFDF
jgi:hypothetical protein